MHQITLITTPRTRTHTRPPVLPPQVPLLRRFLAQGAPEESIKDSLHTGHTQLITRLLPRHRNRTQQGGMTEEQTVLALQGWGVDRYPRHHCSPVGRRMILDKVCPVA